MAVRAKFKVDRIERTLYSGEELQTIVLSPVYKTNDPEDENSKFWKWSPSGSLHLGTLNPEASKQFELGKEYYIDFTPAE